MRGVDGLDWLTSMLCIGIGWTARAPALDRVSSNTLVETVIILTGKPPLFRNVMFVSKSAHMLSSYLSGVQAVIDLLKRKDDFVIEALLHLCLFKAERERV